MSFALFETYKSTDKVCLMNPSKVVIGSNTDLEYAFQIGNFMNMMLSNIKNESKCMTNKVVTHNLLFEVERLHKYCLENKITSVMSSIIYKDGYKTITTWINLLSHDVEIIKEMTKIIDTIKDENIKKQLIKTQNLSIQSAEKKYEYITKIIVETYHDYFRYINVY